MRRLLTGAVLLVLGAPTAIASADSGPFAVGSGDNTFVGTGGPVHLMVSAHGTGTDVSGYVESSGDLGLGPFKQAGPVTCLLVDGNRATIKYRVEQGEGTAPPPGSVVQVFIEDNGVPGSGVPDANATDGPDFSGASASICKPPALQAEWNPVDSGNYTVAG